MVFFPVNARQPHPYFRFHNPTFSWPQLAGRPALSRLTIGSCVCPMLSSSTSANQRKTIIIPPEHPSADLYRHCTHGPQTITAVWEEGSVPVHSTWGRTDQAFSDRSGSPIFLTCDRPIQYRLPIYLE